MKRLTISYYPAETGNDYRPTSQVPYLRMRGAWLRRAGFEIGDRVHVVCEQGALTVTRTLQEEPNHG